MQSSTSTPNAPRKSMFRLVLLLIVVFSFIKFFPKVTGGLVYDLQKAFDRSKALNRLSSGNKELVEEESTIINVVENVSPAVVSIVVKTVDFDLFNGPSSTESGIGTGFIVDPSGIIVTNSHVVDDPDAEYSVVTKDGEAYEVENVHKDSTSDLAIIEITARDLPVVALGDSDNLKVGQKAIAIGNALGRFQNTVTVGVVSGIGRQVYTYGGFGTASNVQENAIQTDAALNPGNSGGPLLNSAGQVIGINVATSVGADNISFSIPVNNLKPILEVFLKEGKIVKPYIGVSYTMITKELASLRRLPEGAFVQRIIKDSPADEAKIQRGDIIVKLGDTAINAELSLAKAIAQRKIGEKVVLEIDREGKIVKVDLTLAEAPEE